MENGVEVQLGWDPRLGANPFAKSDGEQRMESQMENSQKGVERTELCEIRRSGTDSEMNCKHIAENEFGRLTLESVKRKVGREDGAVRQSRSS